MEMAKQMNIRLDEVHAALLDKMVEKLKAWSRNE